MDRKNCPPPPIDVVVGIERQRRTDGQSLEVDCLIGFYITLSL